MLAFTSTSRRQDRRGDSLRVHFHVRFHVHVDVNVPTLSTNELMLRVNQVGRPGPRASSLYFHPPLPSLHHPNPPQPCTWTLLKTAPTDGPTIETETDVHFVHLGALSNTLRRLVGPA